MKPQFSRMWLTPAMVDQNLIGYSSRLGQQPKQRPELSWRPNCGREPPITDSKDHPLRALIDIGRARLFAATPHFW